jgi:anti-sigma factor RsiW
MNAIHCETVRDRLPDLVWGRLDGADTSVVDAHLATCAACAAERDLVDSLRERPVRAPFGLEQRVTRAVRAGRPRWRVSPTRLAMAATVVFALVTAGVLARVGIPGSGPDAGEESTRVAGEEALLYSGAPLMSSAPSLDDLSVEELETLLREMGS